MAEGWPYPGARWWKVDFHTHTPASADTTVWQQAVGTPNEVTPESWLLHCMEAGLDCVAVTDHDTGLWIDPLKEAYARLEVTRPGGFRPLYLFPGVELSVNGGFHLLAIFDRQTTSADIDTLLGTVEYMGTKGDCDGTTRKSAVEVIEKVLAAGGLAIPAHADEAKGLLQLRSDGSAQAALDAGMLQQVFQCNQILATEIVNPAAVKPEIYRSSGRAWTEVLGSDVHTFGKSPLGSRFTWVKMEQPSVEGLRLALLDGERFSVRRSDAPERFGAYRLPDHFIESIRIENARYMGRGQAAELAFSPWLNALVGGRGTGKSTVVHFLRLGYRREKELAVLGEESEAQRAFERFDRVPKTREDHGGLLQDTEAIMTVRRDAVRYRIHWRHDGERTVVEEERGGAWLSSTSQQVTSERFPVRLFSQGQIAALAGESQEALLGVIDDAAKVGRENEALEEARRSFFALRARIRELDGKLESRHRLTVDLEDVERKLRRFEDAHHADVLKAYQLRNRQERELQRQVAVADAVAARIESLGSEIAIEDLPERLFDPREAEDSEAQVLVNRLHAAVGEARRALGGAAAELRAAIKNVRSRLAPSTWQSAVDAAKAVYKDLVAGLREQGVEDPTEYGKLVQDRQRLEQEEARFESMARERELLLAAAADRLREVLEARRALGAQRARFLETALAENPYVRINLVPYGREWRPMEKSVRAILGVPDDRFEDDILHVEDDVPVSGLVAELVAAADLREKWSSTPTGQRVGEDPIEAALADLKDRVERSCRGDGGFGGYFSNYLERECERQPELLDRFLTWFPEDSLHVEYSRTGDGRDFRPIQQASAGQRAAAMLAFLLAHGDEPLVLDQPEDDLDNHLIYDLVVRQIRNNKLRRQIIVVTHNPNIVVNGDAEMVHALSFAKGQCQVKQRGSLQKMSMRDEVCQIMEGGREAFERRYRRLGREV